MQVNINPKAAMKNLIEFFRRNFHYFVLGILQVVAIILIYNNMSYPHFRLHSAVQFVTGPFFEMRQSVVKHFNFAEENERLVQQNSLLLSKCENNFIEKEDTVFSKYDTSSAGVRKQKLRMYDYFYAHVIHNTTHKKNNYLVLDKGWEDGVRPDMAVVSADGVVGVVNNVSKHFASVISLLHPDSRISAKVLPINQVGTILWQDCDPEHAFLIDIPQHLSVNVGDTVVTSGYSNVFPKDLMIGTVSKIDNKSKASFLTIEVALAVNFNNLNTIYLIENLYKTELDTLKASFKDE